MSGVAGAVVARMDMAFKRGYAPSVALFPRIIHGVQAWVDLVWMGPREAIRADGLQGGSRRRGITKEQGPQGAVEQKRLVQVREPGTGPEPVVAGHARRPRIEERILIAVDHCVVALANAMSKTGMIDQNAIGIRNVFDIQRNRLLPMPTYDLSRANASRLPYMAKC